MPTPQHQAYVNTTITRLTQLASNPDLRGQVSACAEAAETLLLLDLEPARKRLESCLAENPRGGRPRDVIVLLRTILVGLLIGVPAYNRFVLRLRAETVLRVLAGLEESDNGPAVATLYAFEKRLLDGPHASRAPKGQRPSDHETERSRSPQPKRETRKSAKAAGRPRPPEDTAKDALTKLVARAEQALPADFVERLNELLFQIAVVPSAEAGLLGRVDKMVVAGDTSVLPTHSNPHGAKTCEHPRFERCDCPRVYSDPDATIGWDSGARTAFFGYRIAEFTCGSMKHDLPVVVDLVSANHPEVCTGLYLAERLIKTLNVHLPEAKVDVAVFDAGFDALHVHIWLDSQGVRPVIPLRSAAPAIHPKRPELKLSRSGIPLCEGLVEMAPAGSAGVNTKMFSCPLRAGRIEVCPLAPDQDPNWHCRPDLQVGPSVAVKVGDDPRLCPRIARNSEKYEKLYRTRTTVERSYGMKKTKFQLLSAHRRRKSGWLFLVAGISILQHALAWRAEAGEEGRVVHALLARIPLAA